MPRMLLPSPLSHEAKFTEVYSSILCLAIEICSPLKISSKTPSISQAIGFGSPINEVLLVFHYSIFFKVATLKLMYLVYEILDTGSKAGFSFRKFG